MTLVLRLKIQNISPDFYYVYPTDDRANNTILSECEVAIKRPLMKNAQRDTSVIKLWNVDILKEEVVKWEIYVLGHARNMKKEGSWNDYPLRYEICRRAA